MGSRQHVTLAANLQSKMKGICMQLEAIGYQSVVMVASSQDIHTEMGSRKGKLFIETFGLVKEFLGYCWDGSVPKTPTIRTTELDNDDNVIFLGQKGGTQMTSSLKNNNDTDKTIKDSGTITVQSENVTAEIVTVRTEPCTDNKLLLYSNSQLLHCAESKLTIGSESKLIPRPGLKLGSLPKRKVVPPPKKKLEPRHDIKLVPRLLSKTVQQPYNELVQRNNITVGSCLPSNHVPNTESKLTKQREIQLVPRSGMKLVPHSVKQGVSASESIMVSESESDTDTGDDELYLAEEGISDTEMKMTHSAIRQTPSIEVNKVTNPDNEQSSTIMSEMVPFPEVRQVPLSMDKQVAHSEICKVQQLEASKIPHRENNEPRSVNDHVPHSEICQVQQLEARKIPHHEYIEPHSVNDHVPHSEICQVQQLEASKIQHHEYIEPHSVNDHVPHSEICQVQQLEASKIPHHEYIEPHSVNDHVPHSEICQVQQLEASKIPHHENNEPRSVNDQVPHSEICQVQQLEASKIPHHENNEPRSVNDQVPHPENNHLPLEPHSDNNHVSQPKENCSVIKLEPGADTKQTPPVGIIKIPSSLIQQVPPGDGKAGRGPLMFIAYHNGKQVTIQVPYPETGQTVHPETKQMPCKEIEPMQHVCEKTSKATTSSPKNLHANQKSRGVLKRKEGKTVKKAKQSTKESSKTPAKTNSSKTPAKTNSSKTPAKTNSSKTPAKTNSSKTPAKTNSSKTPAKTNSSKTPAKTNSSNSPAETKSSKTPAKTKSSNSPAETNSTNNLVKSKSSNITINTKSSNIKAKKHECDQCHKRFTPSGLKKHKRTHAYVRPFKCVSCEEDFVTGLALMKHEVVHDTINSKHCYECTLCDKKYTRFRSLWKHQYYVHRELCKYKNVPLADRPNITPYKSVTSQETFECYKCNKKFHFAHALYNHNRIMHPAEKLSTKCVNCEKDFATVRALRKHEETAHKTMTSRNYHHCNDCDKKFTKIGSLWAHRRNFHSGFPYKPQKHNLPPVVCAICGKSYGRHILRKHIEQAHSGITYKCRFCSKAYKSAYYLKVHESIHMGAKSKLICDLCGFMTHHSACLWKHKIRRHSAKRHRCEFCDMTFHFRPELLQHKTCHMVD